MIKRALLLLAICGFVFAADKPNEKVDRVLVLKSERKLQLLNGSKVLKEYRVALGSSPVGRKEGEGDGKTPEGIYTIDYRKKDSQFHRALHISYPNKADRERAAKAKVNPGGMIMIHGIMNGYGWIGSAHRARDWTLGCIAVTDQEIEEIWALVQDGTTVEIRP
jgi:murein L,D-transpeptidase YafK